MNNKIKNILKILIIPIIIYLFISSLYILFHIDFGNAPEVVGMGFSESNNKVRLFMGLPETRSTYRGVPPIYLLSVVIRLSVAALAIIIVSKKSKIK